MSRENLILPQNVSAILHETRYDKLGDGSGGASSVADKHAKLLPNTALMCPTGKYTPDVMHIPFDSPEGLKGDDLLEYLRTNADALDRISTNIAGVETILAHYYITLGALSDMGRNDRLLIGQGHSWNLAVRRDDPTRVCTDRRTNAEIDALNNFHGIVFSTHAEAQAVAEEYAPYVCGGAKGIESKSYIIPLGVNHEKFNPHHAAKLRREHRGRMLPPELAADDNTVFYVLGRMSDQKGHFQAVQAFAEMMHTSRHNPNASLSLYGGPLEGSYYDQVEDYVRSLPDWMRRRIIFHGAVPGDIGHAIADINVILSSWETWCLTATEGAAMRRAAILSRMPILQEVIGKDNALFVDRSEISQCAQAMELLATDRNARSYYEEAAYKQVSAYTWDKTGQELQRMIEQCKITL